MLLVVLLITWYGAFVTDMHRDCQMMLHRFDRECNTTRYTEEFAVACQMFASPREYRAIYYRVQSRGQDCFVL